MSQQATPTERAAATAGLRALADNLDRHPDIPLSPHGAELRFFVSGDDPDQRAEVDRIATVLGVTPTERLGRHYIAERDFGPVTYQAVAIPAAQRAAHAAVLSYADAVTP